MENEMKQIIHLIIFHFAQKKQIGQNVIRIGTKLKTILGLAIIKKEKRNVNFKFKIKTIKKSINNETKHWNKSIWSNIRLMFQLAVHLKMKCFCLDWKNKQPACVQHFEQFWSNWNGCRILHCHCWELASWMFWLRSGHYIWLFCHPVKLNSLFELTKEFIMAQRRIDVPAIRIRIAAALG